jgi:hypothetical protein
MSRALPRIKVGGGVVSAVSGSPLHVRLLSLLAVSFRTGALSNAGSCNW